MRNYFTILAIIFVCGFSSCVSNRYIYTGSPANNPVFKEKGESQIAAYYSSNPSFGYAHGFDVQAAYAVSDNWAVTAGYYNRSEQGDWDYSVVKYSRNLFDVGGGYFFPVDNKRKLFINAFGGMAVGKYSMNDEGQYLDNAVRKVYLQGALNFVPQDFVSLSVIFKTSFVHYGNLRTTYPIEKQRLYSLDLLNNRTLTFFEPEFNCLIGLPQYSWVKIKFSTSAAYLSGYQYAGFDIRRGNSSIGLSFDLLKMKKTAQDSNE